MRLKDFPEVAPGCNSAYGCVASKAETVTSHSHRVSARCRTTIRNAKPF